MKLSPREFNARLKHGDLTIAFIGMSNIGKTYWSQALVSHEFVHINCDDLIEARLAPILTKLGYQGITDVARWMGQPYEEQFSRTQTQYLDQEKKVMEEILRQLANRRPNSGNLVLDTTGSLVHLNPQICTVLKKYAVVVYFEASRKMQQEMFENYIREPKPVIWEDIFRPEKNEIPLDTLSRCYPLLLAYRSRLYEKYADVIIPRSVLSANTTVEELLQLISA